MQPTPEEIKAEIAKLRGMKPRIWRYTIWGDNNWKAIEAQIEVLENEMDDDDIQARWPDYEDMYYQDAALEALRWMDDGEDAEVPSASWKPVLSVVAPAPPVVVEPKQKKAKKITKRAKMNIYCPACGTWGIHSIPDLSPGHIEYTCSQCNTKFRIQIEFSEIDEEIEGASSSTD